MAVQTKILRRTEDYSYADGKKLTAGTGVLIGGMPGQIYDVAYGPVVHTTSLTKAADIGSFVAGQGIIINAPEYALYGKQGNPLAASLTLPVGSVVSCMTAGHVWMTRKAFTDMGNAMNAAIIWQQPPADPDESTADDSDNDLIVVEVNGLTGSYGPDDSTANG